MEVGSNMQTEKEISLKSAIIIVVAVAAVVIALGLIVGYKFFWNQFSSKTAAELRLEAVEKTVKSFPNNPSAHASLGLEYLRRGETAKAVSELEKANKLDKKNIGIRFSLALAYSEAKQYDKAEPVYLGIIKENPYHFLAQVNLGVLYQNKKEFNKSLNCFNRALLINPGAADVLLLRANTYEALGKKELALQDINKALQYVPDYKEALEAKKRISGK